MGDKFGEGCDLHPYSGLNIMRNRLNIRQQQRLEQIVCEMTALRTVTIEFGPLVRGLSYSHTLHHQLYQDTLDQARQLREIDIYQGGIPLCHPVYSERKDNALIQDLEGGKYLISLGEDEFVGWLAHHYCEINVLHPFRVGSGLVQRILFEQLAVHARYQLGWQGIEKEVWSQANQNGAMGDLTALQTVSGKMIGGVGESE